MKYLFSILIIATLLNTSLCVLTAPPAPFKYVPSLDFQSYQFTPAPSTAGSPLSGIFNYTLTFTDTFTQVPTIAITLCGLENNNGYVGFTIKPTIGGLHSVILELALYGASTINYLNFFILFVNGTLSSGTNFEIIRVQETAPAFNTSGETPTKQTFKSAGFSSGPPNIKYAYLIQSFKIDCNTASNFYVQVVDGGYNSSVYIYSLKTDPNNILSQVVFNIFIYMDNTYSTATYYDYVQFTKNEFGILISGLNTDSSGVGFQKGYNGKCVLGTNFWNFPSTSFSLKFDVTKNYTGVLTTTNYIHTATTINLALFCFMQKFDCSIIHSNCTACETQSTFAPSCIDCINASYVSSGLCQPCEVRLAGCTHCQNDTVCLACYYPAYQYDSMTTSCLSCLVFLTHCLNCTSVIQCDICEPGYGNYNASSCVGCGTLITDCQLCRNSGYCSSCRSGFYLNPLNTSCLSCGIIPNCVTCSSSTVCTGCLQDFMITSGGSQCVCNPGLYAVTGFCSTLGCISAYKFISNNYVSCLACDTSRYFQLFNNTCVCQTGFKLINNSCIQICGDGIKFNAICDDGNLVNGDGCSNLCTQEANYRCFYGNSTTASSCFYVTPLSPTLKNVKKVLDQNKMDIEIEVNNGMAPLDLTNISQYIRLNIGGANFTSFNAVFDSKLGVITIQVPYQYHIQGLPIQLTLGYSPQYFMLNAETLKLDAKGSNMALLYQEQPNGNELLVQNLGYAVASVSIVLLLGSTPFHRIIGLQTFQVTQLVFFSRFMIVQTKSGTFQGLNSLKYIDLYNPFTTYPNVRSLSGSLIRLGFTKTFIFNIMAQAFLVFVAWIFYVFFNRTYQRLRKINLTQSNKAMQMIKKYKLLTYIFNNIASTLTVSSFFIMVFAYLSSAQPEQELVTTLPAQLVVLNAALFFYVSLYICNTIYRNFKESKKYNEEEGSYYRYLSIFLVYYLATSLITISFGNMGIYILAGAQLIFLIVIIVYQPYFTHMHNVCLVINQIVVIGFSALIILNDFVSFLHGFRGYIMLAMESLLIIVNFIGCARLYIHTKYNQKAFEKAKIDADKAKNPPKEQFKIPDPNKNNQIQNALHKTIFERQMEQREKDESMLQKIRNRLKKQFKEKGEQERGSLMEHER